MTPVPKPAPRVKAPRARLRQTPLRTGTPLGRGKPMAKVNRKRKVSEFARCYHSRERVRWVKAQPCVMCFALSPFFGASIGARDNAHTVTDGAGRKADYTTIIPLCRSHHRRYDEHRAPFDDSGTRRAMQLAAFHTQTRWLAHVAASLPVVPDPEQRNR